MSRLAHHGPERLVTVAAALALALLLGPSPARADGPRFGGHLRLVEAGLLPAARAPSGGRDGRVRVSVRVDGGAETLRRAGYAARAAAGSKDSAFVELTPVELHRLRTLPGLVSVEPARTLHTSLDRSLPASGVTQLRAYLGLTGAGAVIGVVDTGVDFRHMDLRSDEGHTRFLGLLDVSQPRTLHPELPAYGGGEVALRADIDAVLDAEAAGMSPATPLLERDTDGHGTHVMGIAASSGLATGKGLPAGRYVGVAPAALLVGVKASRTPGTFSEEDVLSGIQFVFDRAADAGLPSVANLSLGSEGGPHDGTSNFERSISALVPPDRAGRAIVVAAGNGGARDHHAGGYDLDGEVDFTSTFSRSATVTQSLSLELWFSGAPPSITVIGPSGKSYGPVAAGAMLAAGAGGPDGQVFIDDASGGASAQNGRYEATIEVTQDDGVPVAGGDWKVALTGKCARWDAWLTGTTGQLDPRLLDQLDEDERADLPAYAGGVIAVGSYVTRSTWITVDGDPVDRGTIFGQPSTFSGTGPTSDGRFLPDLAAPGDFVASALSIDAPVSSATSVFFVAGDPDYLVADDGVHGLLRGTSQAAPHVAGTVALLYQIDPTLTTARLRELLRTSAALVAGEPGYSPRGGFGRLDAYQAALLLLRKQPGALDPARSSVGASRDLSPTGAPPVTVSVVPRDSTGAPLGPGHVVTIDSDAGTFGGPVTDAGEGRYERILVAQGKDGTVATLHVTVDGTTLTSTPAVYFSASRSEIGLSPASGCAVDPRLAARRGAARVGVGSALLLALSLSVVVAVRRRRRRHG